MSDSFIVTDIGYGDAGKGTTVDYLARHAASSVVVRHSGGAQAAHNVVTPDGRHHTFAQFGSGTFVPHSKTFLSRFMMVNPSAMLWEAKSLADSGVTDAFDRTTVDREAPILTPWHAGANQLREIARGSAAHGSCGVGIGELQMDLLEIPSLILHARDIVDEAKWLRHRLKIYSVAKVRRLRQELVLPQTEEVQEIWNYLESDELIDDVLEDYEMWRQSGITVAEGSALGDLAADTDRLIFEGSQGVLLDEWYGFHPYTTWSTTTSENAETLLHEIHRRSVTRLGVMRSYATRHGNGPFVTEDGTLGESIPESYNGFGRWMGSFRYGHLDLVAHRYAIEATGGVDALIVTGLDRSDFWRYCNEYVLRGDYLRNDWPDYVRLNRKGRVGGLKLGTKGNLEYQERLGRLLTTSCVPCYEPSVDGSQLLAVIEDALGAPISLASYGPSASDKKALAFA